MNGWLSHATLALLVVLLAGWLLLDEAPLATDKILTTLAASEVTQLTLRHRSSDQEIRLGRQAGLNGAAGEWQLLAPLNFAAESYKVESLLKILSAAVISHFKPTADLGDYGLATPSLQMVFNNTLTLNFGKQTPVDNHRYLQLGDEIFVVRDTVYAMAGMAVGDYLNRHPLPAGALIASIHTGTHTLTFAEGGWQVEPAVAGLNSEQITEWLNSWRHLYAMNVEWDVAAAAALVAATDRVVQFTFQEEGVPALQLHYRQQAGEVQLVNAQSGVIYTIHESSATTLFDITAMVRETPDAGAAGG
ncbi:MAG: DUF4340 domain-containing protein [Gammaproteobacteria bacterium]|nr:DUF4340 domain-containing protein [Gammaproteobacteria bacterium]